MQDVYGYEKKASGRILLSYEYDRNGNRIAQTDLTGKRSEYVYNSLDLLTEVRDNGKTLARYDYETDGMIRTLTVGEDIITSYAYDADKNITAQKTVMGSDVIVDNRYGYDGNGNRMFRHTMSGHTTYRYDERNRLVEAEYPKYRESLRYDMAGNRIERQTETVKELYTYDSCNRLTERRKAENGKEDLRETYAYDRQGNLLECTKEREGAKPETSRFTYDAFGRQSSARMYDGRVQVNRYDAEGLRHEMEENGQLVTFLYSGREVVAEESETTGMLRYIRGYELISSDSESARTYYHYVGDEDGSITHVVGNAEDESGAQAGKYRIFNRYEYDAFGAYQIREESVHNRFGYNGEQYDPVTGQYYLRARYYNPVIGRFTQEDTYYGDGLNLYAYCHNNPVGYEDPSGHVCKRKYNNYKKLRELGLSPKEAYAYMKKAKEVQGRKEKGDLGEELMNTIMKKQGYEKLESKLKSNNGIDGVYVKRDPKTDKIIELIIGEAKFGDSKLGNPSVGPQMGDDWIIDNINKMAESDNPKVKSAGEKLKDYLKDGGTYQAVIFRLRKTGHLGIKHRNKGNNNYTRW